MGESVGVGWVVRNMRGTSTPGGSIGVYIGQELGGQLTKKMTERHKTTLWTACEAGFTCTCFAFLERDANYIIQVKLSLLKLPD